MSLDGKTVKSTGKMSGYKRAMHIVSAHIANLGITIAQKTVDGKSNEIPAVRELLAMLDISGCMVVADALNCQRETAKVIVDGGGDYLLSVKGNQTTLQEDIEDYVQDPELQATMNQATTMEKNNGRIEHRTAFATTDISWIIDREKWKGMVMIGAIKRKVTDKNGTTNEWHYYISNREMTAQELLDHARLEWTVESMHWLLDVHFSEDFCRVENKNVQQNLNMIRKIALNSIRHYKNTTSSKRPFSKLMFDALLDPKNILSILNTTLI